MPEVKAIDIQRFPCSPEFVSTWDRVKEGELMCRIEKSLGGRLPVYDTIEMMVEDMDQAGVEKVGVIAPKIWSYWKKKDFIDTPISMVTPYIEKYPDRFFGIAGYNPYRVKESLNEIETAVKNYNFRGVYVHIYGYDIPLDDAKLMYPLYEKCIELDIPVEMQVGHVLEAMYGGHGRPIYLDRIAADFEDKVKLIGTHTGYPWIEELISVCYKWDNVWFGATAWAPRLWSPSIVNYLNSRLGAERAIWGTNMLPWKEQLEQIDALGFREENKRKLIRENAIKLFKL